MKRFLCVIMAVVMFLPLFAQERMQFKGIPMEGTVKNFASKLVQKKFKVVEEDADATVLQGTFAGRIGAYVILYPISERNSNIGQITVLVEAGENWNTIKENYEDVVDLYTEKYGEPKGHLEEFEGDVISEIVSLREDKCIYTSYWEFEYGSIEVLLKSLPFPIIKNDFVVITYRDDESNKQIRKDMLEDI